MGWKNKNKFKREKVAFTLAEVLITLGIIGVIAAMTIPSLMTNIAKKEALSKLTKAYAEISQAYKMSYNDLSEPTADEVNSMGAVAYYEEYWKPYIKSSNYCMTAQECGYTSSLPWYWLDGTKATTGVATNSDRGIAFSLPSGVLCVIRASWNGTPDENGKYPNNSLIIFDINGGHLPNVMGKDVFVFERTMEAGTLETPCQSYSNAVVDKNCSGSGWCCAEKIRRAGWKMDSTYPW